MSEMVAVRRASVRRRRREGGRRREGKKRYGGSQKGKEGRGGVEEVDEKGLFWAWECVGRRWGEEMVVVGGGGGVGAPSEQHSWQILPQNMGVRIFEPFVCLNKFG
jgi:hypothetical protein